MENTPETKVEEIEGVGLVSHVCIVHYDENGRQLPFTPPPPRPSIVPPELKLVPYFWDDGDADGCFFWAWAPEDQVEKRRQAFIHTTRPKPDELSEFERWMAEVA